MLGRQNHVGARRKASTDRESCYSRQSKKCARARNQTGLATDRMGLSAKLMMRQGQTLTMTPQLLQAIKLLQFSNLELSAFIETELERCV